MQSPWLNAANFERTQELVSAINKVVVHANSRLVGGDDPTPVGEVARARTHLVAFVERLRDVVERAEQDGSGLIIGADPRTREIARQVLDPASRSGMPGQFTVAHLTELPDLVRSEQTDDLQELVPRLRGLRALIEERAQSDVANMLGQTSW